MMDTHGEQKDYILLSKQAYFDLLLLLNLYTIVPHYHMQI